MYKRLLLAVVLVLMVSVIMTSCAKKPDVDAGSIPPELPPVEDPAGPPPEETEPATAEVPEASAVVEQVGAPLYEGAEAGTVEIKEGDTVATFSSAATYADVKAFYMEKLVAPDWSNNGFEMGAMGGDEWEFKSADESKLVLVKRDSGADKTEIRFTVKAAGEAAPAESTPAEGDAPAESDPTTP